MDAVNTVSKISIQLLLSEPFFGQLLIELPKIFDKQIESIGLSISDKLEIILLINKHFWEQSNEDEKKGLLKHELLHLIFGHVTTLEQYPEQALFHIAADLECNQYIPNHQLSSSALTTKKLNFPESKKRLPFFYKVLKEQFTAKEIQQLLSDYSILKKHQQWIINETYKAGKKKIIEHQIQSLLKRVTLSINKTEIQKTGIPEGIFAQLAIDPDTTSFFPKWYSLLNTFLAKSAQTVLKNTVHQASKRYGTIPGIKIRRKQKLLIAIDTSGSMDQEVIKEIFILINTIYKKASILTIIECDFEIRNTYRYKGIIPAQISGRGDTAYDPVLRFANEQFQPDALIYFTDGFGACPKVNTDFPLLWVITSEGIKKESSAWTVLPGEKIKLEK